MQISIISLKCRNSDPFWKQSLEFEEVIVALENNKDRHVNEHVKISISLEFQKIILTERSFRQKMSSSSWGVLGARSSWGVNKHILTRI